MAVDFYEYSELKVETTDPAQLKKIYTKKEDLLKKLSEQYLSVVELGVTEWSLASLYMLGLSLEEFANFLYAIPVPKELNTDELKREYDNQIKAQAMPYEDEAMDYYEKTMSESARLKTVNIWTKYAQTRLIKLKPESNKQYKEEIYVNSPSMDIIDYGFMGQ